MKPIPEGWIALSEYDDDIMKLSRSVTGRRFLEPRKRCTIADRTSP